MRNIYRKDILDHYKNPRNYGRLRKADLSCEKENIFCGDKIRIELKIDRKKKIVKDIRFTATGCAISKAAASLLTEYAKGKPITKIKKLSLNDFLVKTLKLSLSPLRAKCAELSLLTLKEALKKNRN